MRLFLYINNQSQGLLFEGKASQTLDITIPVTLHDDDKVEIRPEFDQDEDLHDFYTIGAKLHIEEHLHG